MKINNKHISLKVQSVQRRRKNTNCPGTFVHPEKSTTLNENNSSNLQ